MTHMCHRVVALLIAVLATQPGGPARASTCLEAAATAEQRHGIPSGLLGAIGRVESGNWNWSVNGNGNEPGHRFDGADSAEQYVRSLQDAGQRMIDVGCFQVDLFYHPDAFAQWQDAFDSTGNAEVAAIILGRLHERTGDWDRAVSLYHSASPDRGQAYLDSVLYAWKNGVVPGTPASFAGPDPHVAVAWEPVGITVWSPDMRPTPGNLPHDGQSILPRIITP